MSELHSFFLPPEGTVPALLTWYTMASRDLPWRRNITPYRVWVSEIMLQQTRVEAVRSYFLRFTETLPDVQALAAAEEDKLLKLWEGLGYYSRVRNMQKAARQVMEQHGGALPASYEELIKLPGIGSYTAGAIASIAFGISAPAVDGNVLRVLARLTCCDTDILLPATKKQAEEVVAKMIPAGRAGQFTQAMMELGAVICVPNGEAKCGECPVSAFCKAYEQGKVKELPVRSPKAKRRIEECTVLLLSEEGKYALRRRPSTGLLAGLYEFPNLPGKLNREQALEAARELGFEPLHILGLQECKHIFTHVEWHMVGYLMKGNFEQPQTLLADYRQLKSTYAVPSAFAPFLKLIKEKSDGGND